VAQASFFVARALVAALRPGDSVHMVRNDAVGLAISVIRDGRCIAAAGAVSNVPLGSKLQVSFRWQQLEAAEAILRERDPDFQFCDIPVEVTIAGETRLLFGGLCRLGEYEVFVIRPYSRGIPGTSECVGLSHVKLCETYAANASAELLLSCAIATVKW
jgi:hypothetical protein